MVITMKLQHVIQRGKTYHFRMPVPKDCIEKIGKREIVQSLKTEDPAVAKAAAKKLEADCKQRFDAIRKGEAPSVPEKPVALSIDSRAELFRQKITGHMNACFPQLLAEELDKELRDRLDFYKSGIAAIKENSWCQFDFEELGVKWPLKPSGTPGLDRQCKRILSDVLLLMCKTISRELGIALISSATPVSAVARTESSVSPAPAKTADSSQNQDIRTIVELMIDAKGIPEKTAIALRADIGLLREWCDSKDDIASYTKRDLIDFIQNALPYVPVHMNKRKEYCDQRIKDIVALTKSDPKTYKPISHRTCENRQTNISMVFNYAKNHLGLITVNPATDIRIPEVRVSEVRPRGYTQQELIALWNALRGVQQNTTRPSFYWSTVLSLYHGFRMNEACSLFLKDVYEDQDGIFVIDINENGPLKKVKNQSSVRIVPVHPFVRDQLGFKDFVTEQKNSRTEGTLFTDVTGTEKNGYIRQTSYWFAHWKKEWLPPESQYKHFHDLRYTFTQTAQNSAKIPDRHSQEITGHTIEGVSKVHLGYSGRLKPVDLLTELTKVRYGWETD